MTSPSSPQRPIFSPFELLPVTFNDISHRSADPAKPPLADLVAHIASLCLALPESLKPFEKLAFAALFQRENVSKKSPGAVAVYRVSLCCQPRALEPVRIALRRRSGAHRSVAGLLL